MPREPNPDKPKRAPAGPRPGYLILKGETAAEFAEALRSGAIQMVGTSRNAEDVLKLVSSGEADAYVRFEIK